MNSNLLSFIHPFINSITHFRHVQKIVTMTKGGNASDYYCYGFCGDQWPMFWYKKSADGSRMTTVLCARGTNCKPYNELCSRASVQHFGMICNDCAVVELDAKFPMTSTGCSTVSMYDPTSIEQSRITIQLTSYKASSNPKVPKRYRSLLGDTETAVKIYNRCMQDIETSAAHRQERRLCCYEGCGTQVTFSNCYCL